MLFYYNNNNIKNFAKNTLTIEQNASRQVSGLSGGGGGGAERNRRRVDGLST